MMSKIAGAALLSLIGISAAQNAPEPPAPIECPGKYPDSVNTTTLYERPIFMNLYGEGPGLQNQGFGVKAIEGKAGQYAVVARDADFIPRLHYDNGVVTTVAYQEGDMEGLRLGLVDVTEEMNDGDERSHVWRLVFNAPASNRTKAADEYTFDSVWGYYLDQYWGFANPVPDIGAQSSLWQHQVCEDNNLYLWGVNTTSGEEVPPSLPGCGYGSFGMQLPVILNPQARTCETLPEAYPIFPWPGNAIDSAPGARAKLTPDLIVEL